MSFLFFLIGWAKQPASVITLSRYIINHDHPKRWASCNIPFSCWSTHTHPLTPRFLAFQREASDWALLWECSFPQHIASRPGWNGQTWTFRRLVLQYLVRHVMIYKKDARFRIPTQNVQPPMRYRLVGSKTTRRKTWVSCPEGCFAS